MPLALAVHLAAATWSAIQRAWPPALLSTGLILLQCQPDQAASLRVIPIEDLVEHGEGMHWTGGADTPTS